MNTRRIGVLLSKELFWGPKNFLFIWAIVVPLVLTLLIQLLVGSFFSGKPWLGVVDLGESQLVGALQGVEGISVQRYDTAVSLHTAVAQGRLDMGLVLPADFDRLLRESDTAVPLTVYVYGESLVSNRMLLGVTLVNVLREATGLDTPVTIVTETVGEGESIPWEQRLLPFVVLMTIILGGMMLPAALLVQEKQNRTLTAVATAAVTLEEIFIAKGLVGFLVSLGMGITILILNQAFGAQPLLLVGILALGALLAAIFGVLLGAFVKDINSLFATIKGLGILLYAPALIYLFPSLPQWIARLFPTYYIVGPIIDVTQNGAGLADIAVDVAILVGLILLMIGIVAYVARQARTRPTLLPGVVG